MDSHWAWHQDNRTQRCCSCLPSMGWCFPQSQDRSFEGSHARGWAWLYNKERFWLWEYSRSNRKKKLEKDTEDTGKSFASCTRTVKMPCWASTRARSSSESFDFFSLRRELLVLSAVEGVVGDVSEMGVEYRGTDAVGERERREWRYDSWMVSK